MAANRNIGRQPEAPSPLISGMRPVGMKRTALLLAAVAALWAAPAQTDFLTLQENVDASGTALMCPTRADNYVDCADAGTLPVPSMRGRAAAPGQPRLATAHHGHDRHSRREARRRGWQDHLYLRAHGEGQHRGRKGDYAGRGHSRAASFIRILADPRPRMGLIDIRPAASHLLRKLVRQPSGFVGGIVLSTRML
jgi:hypothetical protein